MHKLVALTLVSILVVVLWILVNGLFIDPLYGATLGLGLAGLVIRYSAAGLLVGLVASYIAFRITYSFISTMLGIILGGAVTLIVLPMMGFMVTSQQISDLVSSLSHLLASLIPAATLGKLTPRPQPRRGARQLAVQHRVKTPQRMTNPQPSSRPQDLRRYAGQEGAIPKTKEVDEPSHPKQIVQEEPSNIRPKEHTQITTMNVDRAERYEEQQSAIQPSRVKQTSNEVYVDGFGDEISLTSLEQRLLDFLVVSEVKEVVPIPDRTTIEGGRYPSVEEQLQIDTSTTINLLNSLAEKNILRRAKLEFKVITCPGCGSALSMMDFVCKACKSPNITRQRILQHLLCGYMGPESMFGRGEGRLVCPRCGEAIGSSGEAKVGIEIPQAAQLGTRVYSSFFRCYDCGEISMEPYPMFKCLTCGNTYDSKDFEARYFYRYVQNEEVISRIAAGQKPVKLLVDRLREAGYEVEAPASIVGTSKVTHRLDVLVKHEQRHVAGIVVITTPEHLSVFEVMRISILKIDASLPLMIALASSPLSEDARRLAESQDIFLVEISDSRELEKQVIEPVLKEIGREVWR